MNNNDFEKLAGQLARSAVTGETLPENLVQIKTAFVGGDAGRYLLGGLGGAGIGALIGATQGRNKKRNALYYGTLGGLGGLGLAHFMNSGNSAAPTPATTPPAKITPPVKVDKPANKTTTDLVVRPDTASIETLTPQHGGKGEDVHVPVVPRYEPEDVRKEFANKQNLGPKRTTDAFGVSQPEKEIYENWKSNPSNVSWLQKWLYSKKFQEQAAAEKLMDLQMPGKQHAGPPGTTAAPPMTAVERAHAPYAQFQIKGTDGNPTGEYKPGALELIQKARAYGFGDNADRVLEFQKGLAAGYSPWYMRLADQMIGEDNAGLH